MTNQQFWDYACRYRPFIALLVSINVTLSVMLAAALILGLWSPGTVSTATTTVAGMTFVILSVSTVLMGYVLRRCRQRRDFGDVT